MAEEKKPVQSEKTEQKTVPLAEFLKVKKSLQGALDKAKEELAEQESKVGELQLELKVAKAGEDEEEISEVKKHLIVESEKIKKERAQLDKDLASQAKEKKEREREATVKELASKYEIDAELLLGEDNPKEKALELYIERLTREKGEPPESIYESNTPGSPKKQPMDMTDEEFEKEWESRLSKAQK